MSKDFTAPTAYPVFYRTYSRRSEQGRESWQEVCDRAQYGLAKVGKFKQEESDLCREMQEKAVTLPSGRWLWVGGTEWAENPNNFSSTYNCTSSEMIDWEAFGLLMDLAMQGSGTGAILEDRCTSQLPVIRNRIKVVVLEETGSKYDPSSPVSETSVELTEYSDFVLAQVVVGDSRQGWVKAYQTVLELSSTPFASDLVRIQVDTGFVRPEGVPLKGFGGVANPIKLNGLFPRLAEILNRAIGRKLEANECCALIDEAALVVVAGNLRRSAGMRQFDKTKPVYKVNLWIEGEDGTWRIDPERDSMRMANHTRVYHSKPSREECIDAVRLQFESGEGAIQYAPEAIARANADLLDTPEKKANFLHDYSRGPEFAASCLVSLSRQEVDEYELNHRMIRYGLNPLTLAA